MITAGTEKGLVLLLKRLLGSVELQGALLRHGAALFLRGEPISQLLQVHLNGGWRAAEASSWQLGPDQMVSEMNTSN